MIDKNSYITVTFGAFNYSGDIEHLDKAIEEVQKLRETVDLIEEPEDVAKVYG